MPDPDPVGVPDTPFEAFRFAVEIHVPGVSPRLCRAAFAECVGPSVTLETRTVREGGSNASRVQLTGAHSLGLVTLRRGMSRNLDLWKWISEVLKESPARPRGELRADAEIVLLGPDGFPDRTRIVLRRCLPVHYGGPSLNAAGGTVAIEELQLACESIELLGPGEKPSATGGTPLARAQLRELDADLEHEAVPGLCTTVQFNPEGLRVSFKRALASEDVGQAGNASAVSASTVSRLSALLLFDVTVPAAKGTESVRDVRQLTRGVGHFITTAGPAGNPSRPPRGVRFKWGSFQFDGIMESMEETLELFSDDGTPLRARVAIELVRYGIADHAWPA